VADNERRDELIAADVAELVHHGAARTAWRHRRPRSAHGPLQRRRC
jgi:hypothetical protein